MPNIDLLTNKAINLVNPTALVFLGVGAISILFGFLSLLDGEFMVFIGGIFMGVGMNFFGLTLILLVKILNTAVNTSKEIERLSHQNN